MLHMALSVSNTGLQVWPFLLFRNSESLPKIPKVDFLHNVITKCVLLNKGKSTIRNFCQVCGISD